MSRFILLPMSPHSLEFPVAGMTCASCVSRVERALKKVPGVDAASVNLATEQATVESAAPLDAAALSAAVAQAGFELPQATLRLAIDGMTCASCVSRVEKALKKVPGVLAASVNLATNTADVQWLAGTPADALLAAVDRAGYSAQVQADGSIAAPAVDHEGWLVALGALLAAPLVLPMAGDLFGAHWMLPALWQFLLAAPVQFFLGARFYRAGWKALRAGSGNMDLLVALGTSAAFGLSLWLWARSEGGMPHLYLRAPRW